MAKTAAFLDRDGVIIKEIDNLTEVSQVMLIQGSAEAIKRLNDSGILAIIVTNQPAVARGYITEKKLQDIHHEMEKQIEKESGGKIDAIYFCPHHPNADVPEYRKQCECRKPLAGMLRSAAREHDIDLSVSYMVGDRQSDIFPGIQAGCRANIQVLSGAHDAKPITSSIISGEEIQSALPDYVCKDLKEAVDFILKMEEGQ